MSNYQPSKEYFENLERYKKMHMEGHRLSTVKIRTSDVSYNGKSTLIFAKLIKVICMCTVKENEKFQYFPLQYNDKLTNYSSK